MKGILEKADEEDLNKRVLLGVSHSQDEENGRIINYQEAMKQSDAF